MNFAQNNMVSIIIVSYNCERFMPKLALSIHAQTYPFIETILIDNNPGDNSVHAFIEHFQRKVTIIQSSNIGFAAAQNLGIRNSSGEYVLVLNPDIILEPNFIEVIIEAVKKENACMAAGLIRNLYDTSVIDSAGIGITRGRYFFDRYRGMREVPSRNVSTMFGPSGSVALYTRKLISAIAIDGEFFDESFFMYYEDVDVAWRAHLFGYNSIFVPNAVAYHARSGTQVIRNPYMDALIWLNRYGVIIKNDSIKNFNALQLIALIFAEFFWWLKLLKNFRCIPYVLKMRSKIRLWFNKSDILSKRLPPGKTPTVNCFSGSIFEILGICKIR